MSDVESWLSNTQDRVETAQLVLSEVERGLVAVQTVETVAKRARPVLRAVSVGLPVGMWLRMAPDWGWFYQSPVA